MILILQSSTVDHFRLRLNRIGVHGEALFRHKETFQKVRHTLRKSHLHQLSVLLLMSPLQGGLPEPSVSNQDVLDSSLDTPGTLLPQLVHYTQIYCTKQAARMEGCHRQPFKDFKGVKSSPGRKFTLTVHLSNNQSQFGFCQVNISHSGQISVSRL